MFELFYICNISIYLSQNMPLLILACFNTSFPPSCLLFQHILVLMYIIYMEYIFCFTATRGIHFFTLFFAREILMPGGCSLPLMQMHQVTNGSYAARLSHKQRVMHCLLVCTPWTLCKAILLVWLAKSLSLTT